MLPAGTSAVVELTEHMEALRNARKYAEARKEGEQGESLAVTPRDHELLDVALALATYKDPQYPTLRGLHEALALIEPHLARSVDPETLGVAGAIEKRLYDVDVRIEHLERSLKYYELGHVEDRDHDEWPSYGYPGINAAFVLELLASLRPEESEDFMERARALWQELVNVPAPPNDAPAHKRYFHRVTVADAALGLGHLDRALAEYESARNIMAAKRWQVETTARQLATVLRLRSPDGRVDDAGRKVLAALVGDSAEAVASAVRGKVGLGLSGGGFRASLFHIGVLARLAELDVLRHVEVLSCVSGGSLLGALYYLELKKLYEEKPDAEIGREDFVELVKRLALRFPQAVQKNLRTRLLLSPSKNAAMLRGELSRSLLLAELYEEHLYAEVGEHAPKRSEPRFMDELVIEPYGTKKKKRQGNGAETSTGPQFKPKHENWQRRARVPVVVLNAASLNTGHAWHFSAAQMGEPPVRAEEDVDVNDRFERHEYEDFPRAWKRVRLGHAAAASACVPALFEPLELRGAYGEHVVRLVDGGVHDNQGVAALLEADCTALIVSDASGQMSLVSNPKGDALGVGLRSDSVLQARLREAQYQDLRSRERGKLIRALCFLHLKKGIVPRSISPMDPDGISQKNAAPSSSDAADLGYGVSQAVQERLADLRTDLDAFSELEAEMLMASGYRMAERFFDATKFEVAPTPLPHPAVPSYGFLRVAPLLLAKPDGTPTQKRVLELLQIGSAVLGKGFKVSTGLRNGALALGGVTFLVLAALAYRFQSSSLVQVSVGSASVGALLALVRWKMPNVGRFIDVATPAGARDAVLKKLLMPLVERFVAYVAAAGAWLSVRFADRRFLEAGLVQPLLASLADENQKNALPPRSPTPPQAARRDREVEVEVA